MPSIINSDDGVVSGTSGLKSTGGNDGLLNIQSNGSTIVAVTGSGISVTGTVSQTGVSTFAAGTVSAPSITFTGDTNTGIFSPAADTIAFTEGGVESMRITSAGDVGVGTTSPNLGGVNKAITLNSAAGTNASYELSINGTFIGSMYTNTADSSLRFGGWQNAPMVFLTNSTERMRINAGAPILCLSGGNTSATGTGIAFPATQSASSDANTLDDYEEGTWTPTWYGSGTAGTPSGSASGKYTKIGNMVTVSANFSAINLTGATGNFIIGGLPFSHTSGANGACYFEGITPSYSTATVTGSGLAVSPYSGTQLALKPSITTAWDNYLLATSTFTGGGGSTYGYFTVTYFV